MRTRRGTEPSEGEEPIETEGQPEEPTPVEDTEGTEPSEGEEPIETEGQPEEPPTPVEDTEGTEPSEGEEPIETEGQPEEPIPVEDTEGTEPSEGEEPAEAKEGLDGTTPADTETGLPEGGLPLEGGLLPSDGTAPTGEGQQDIVAVPELAGLDAALQLAGQDAATLPEGAQLLAEGRHDARRPG